ncbi:hypothetical protein L3V83_14585, partial [Thiotrichales bacterium 19X7-9]|nr:hypothetical protein [Thiotrichales bacterium 19X7-9]
MPIDYRYRPISDPPLKDKNINNFKNAIAESMIITDKSIIKDYDSTYKKLHDLISKLHFGSRSYDLVNDLWHTYIYISRVLSSQKDMNTHKYYINDINQQLKNIKNGTTVMSEKKKREAFIVLNRELTASKYYYKIAKREYKERVQELHASMPRFISNIKDSYYELFRNIKNKDDETYKIMHEASQWLAMALDSSMDAIYNDKETILIPDVDPRSNYLAHKVVDVDTLAETLTGLVNEEEIERNIFSEISSFCNISDKHILDSAKEYLKKYLNEHIRLIDS